MDILKLGVITVRKKNLLILILVFVITVVGCKPTIGTEEVDMGKVEDTELSISDYFPFEEDTSYDYEGIGNEFAEQKIYFEYIEGNKAQLKVINPATHVVKVVEYGDGALSEIYYEGEFYHTENLLNIKEMQSNILIKEPLVVGNSWVSSDGYNKTITGLDVELETPLDSYKALEITTDFGEGKTLKQYYARDIGLVASIYEDGIGKVETLLKSIRSEAKKIDLEVYYPFASETDIETVYTMEEVDFYTNQRMEELLEDLMKNPPSNDLLPTISKNTVINSIKLDRNSWTLLVDFSQDLLTDMNAGSSLEAEILTSIVNTLGRFYDVDKVYITIEGKTYESGHFVLLDDEFFRVDIDDIKMYR